MARTPKVLRYGAIDMEGRWLFSPRFETLGAHGDARLPFGEGGKQGFADLHGHVVVPAQYDFVYPFRGGAACVERDGHWSAIDVDGKPLPGWRARPSEGRVRTCVGFWPSRDRAEPCGSFGQASFGFLDLDGRPCVDPIYFHAHDYRHGLAVVKLAGAGTSSFAYLDLEGRVALGPFEAWDARSFGDNGLARLNTIASGWQFIDRSGAVVIQAPGEVEPFAEGLAAVTSRDQKSPWGPELKGYFDTQGKLVIDFLFEVAGPFSDGLAAVTTHVGPTPLVGFIDPSGALVIEHRFRLAHAFCGDVAPAAVQHPQYWSSNVWGLVGRDGQWVVEPTLRSIWPFRGGAAVFQREDGTCGLFDRHGQVIADGYVSFVHAGFPSAVNRGGKVTASGRVSGGKWGFVDASGREHVACVHHAVATPFHDDVACVGDKVGVESATG